MSLSRAYLETLSSGDLVSLADEYGIDIPEGLNRRFIIGELLEVMEDAAGFSVSQETLAEGTVPENAPVLPISFNETRISVLLRNPAWVYVYWDFKESLFAELSSMRTFNTFVLRICFFNPGNMEKVRDYYDIPVELADRNRYVFLSHSEYAFKIELVAEFRNLESRALAQSGIIIIPRAPDIRSFGGGQEMSPLLELSELAELRRIHFINHRQSFL